MVTLIWAGIVFVDESATPQSHFGVCVEDNRIIATGKYHELHARYPNAQIVGSEKFLLAPTFVNSHDHGRALNTLSLGVTDDLLEIWLLKLSSLPIIDPYLAAAYDGLRLLRSGVGTVAHSHNPRSWQNMEAEAIATLKGYRDAGIRAAFHPPIVDQNPLVYGDAKQFLATLPADKKPLAKQFMAPVPLARQDYFGLCTDLVKTYHDTEQFMCHIQVSPAGGQWCSDELILEAVDFARRYQTRLQMHLLETSYQRQYAYRQWGKSFVQHLDEIGALGEWLTCAHMVWVDEEDLSLLAERKVGIAHNPSSNLRLRSGMAPIAKMVNAGVVLGIGLDGHSLDNDQDYLREMRLALTLSNQPGANALTVTAPTIWQMGTTGGAKITLGKNVPLGKLVPNHLADLVLIDWSAVQDAAIPELYGEMIPTVEILLRQATRHHVKHVMVNGNWVVWDGKSKTLAENMLIAALREELAKQDKQKLLQTANNAEIVANYLRRFYAQWD
ncbi:MAG: amidohydrolase family protein [Chlorogloeopsis fritschii C42_A2020_084]|uniref:amidohydrolase family protein n=1 Tax=Chlorogloeopsis fritschii TaxID=1124 RepID=UPI0019D892F5|nr:amidohydrolase family protein [Chlorogloeopsis fritschii]MBF2008610.1 amidohydrolase family protein [Chlorogloeopsis fritschii C42_A2020_084]